MRVERGHLRVVPVAAARRTGRMSSAPPPTEIRRWPPRRRAAMTARPRPGPARSLPPHRPRTLRPPAPGPARW